MLLMGFTKTNCPLLHIQETLLWWNKDPSLFSGWRRMARAEENSRIKECLKWRLLLHTSEDVIKGSEVDLSRNVSLTPVLKRPLCLEEWGLKPFPKYLGFCFLISANFALLACWACFISQVCDMRKITLPPLWETVLFPSLIYMSN